MGGALLEYVRILYSDESSAIFLPISAGIITKYFPFLGLQKKKNLLCVIILIAERTATLHVILLLDVIVSVAFVGVPSSFCFFDFFIIRILGLIVSVGRDL